MSFCLKATYIIATKINVKNYERLEIKSEMLVKVNTGAAS